MSSVLETMARAIVNDGRKDREVLRRRWLAHAPSPEIARIVETLARYPLLIPSVNKHIAVELERLGTDYSVPGASRDAATLEKEPANADRQTTTLSNV